MNDASLVRAVGAEGLPSFLTAQLRQAEGVDPRLQLTALLYLFENILRLATAIAVGELRQRHEVAPERIAQSLLFGMSNPTLDTWRDLCGQVSRFLSAGTFAPSLLQDAAKLGKLAEEVRFRQRRNDTAHVPVGSTWARETLDALAPKMKEALASLGWLRDMDLVVEDGSARVPVSADTRIALAAGKDATVVAARAGIEINLFPFVLVVPGAPTSGLGVCRTLTIGWDAVDAYDLGPDPRPARLKGGTQLQEFRVWCRYADRKRLQGAGPAAKDLTRVQRIFGRDRELRKAAEAVTTSAITWVEGPAGIGKSLLLEHVARNHRVRGGGLVYWRFDTREPVPPLVLYKYLAEQLKPRDAHLPRLGDDANAWLRHLQVLVTDAPPKPTLVVLDALDEATTLDFAELPFALASDRLKWLCSGRPNEELRKIFGAERCHRLELAPISADAVREWVEAEVPNLLDEVDALENAAGGLPLYVRLVLSEHDAGRFRPGDSLPGAEKLEDVWKAAIRRATSASPAAARWVLDIVQVAAASVEPLTSELIRHVLSHAGTLILEEGEDQEFLRALDATSSLLIKEELLDGIITFRPIHATLVEVLRKAKEYRHSRAQVQRGLLSFIEKPSNVSERAHVARAGIRQLVALQRVDRAVELLADYEWIRMRLYEADGTHVDRRLDMLAKDLDYVSQFVMNADLEALRSFLASNNDLVPELGDVYLYQCCANGQLGAYWRERGAIPWATRRGSDFRSPWLEVVSETRGRVAPIVHMPNPSFRDGAAVLERGITSMVFEPDSRCILTTHKQGPGFRVDLRTGARTTHDLLRGHVVGFDRIGNLWSVADGCIRALRRLEGETEYRVVVSESFSGTLRGSWQRRDGFVISVQDDAEYRLISLPELQVEVTEHHDAAELARACAISKSEPPLGFLIAAGTILVGHGDREADKINTVQGAVTSRGAARVTNVTNVCIAESTGLLLCIPMFHKDVELRDVHTLAILESIPIVNYELDHKIFITTSTGPVANVAVFATAGGPLVLCDLAGRKATATAQPHLGWCSALALSADGRFLATADEVDVKVWRREELAASSPSSPAPDYPAVRLLIAERADRVARLEYDGDLSVFEFSSGRHIATKRKFGKPIGTEGQLGGVERYCAMSADSRRIATVDFDGFRVVDIAEDRVYNIWFDDDQEYDPKGLESIRLSADGSILVALHYGLGDHEIAWEVETGDRVALPMPDAQEPQLRAETTAPRLVRFLDSSSGATAVWHAEVDIDIAAIGPDGRAVIATSDGGLVMLRLRAGGLPGGLRLVET